MIWVCRAGKNACFIDKYISTNRIYIPWEGFSTDLSSFKSISDFRSLVVVEKGIDNHTSVSNWSGQLRCFAQEMTIGDLVIIPDAHSRKYHLAKIIGQYEYLEKCSKFCHSRKIQLLLSNIPREIFPQKIQYSLGAYRTLFKAKNESEILKYIQKWQEE